MNYTDFHSNSIIFSINPPDVNLIEYCDIQKREKPATECSDDGENNND